MKLLNFDLIMNNIVEEEISSDYLLIAEVIMSYYCFKWIQT